MAKRFICDIKKAENCEGENDPPTVNYNAAPILKPKGWGSLVLSLQGVPGIQQRLTRSDVCGPCLIAMGFDPDKPNVSNLTVLEDFYDMLVEEVSERIQS